MGCPSVLGENASPVGQPPPLIILTHKARRLWEPGIETCRLGSQGPDDWRRGTIRPTPGSSPPSTARRPIVASRALRSFHGQSGDPDARLSAPPGDGCGQPVAPIPSGLETQQLPSPCHVGRTAGLAVGLAAVPDNRSEERRVGKRCRSRVSPEQLKKKQTKHNSHP